jgi:hypothetical protein
MSKSSIRKLIIFLLVNVILAVFISLNVIIKHHDLTIFNSLSNFLNKEKINSHVDNIIAKNNLESPKQIASEPVIISPKQVTSEPAIVAQNPIVSESVVSSVNTKTICIAMGPFNIEQKGTMETILSKENQSYLASSEKRSAYQVFWNLGTNKKEAEKLFKKQKDGAMADSKFTMVQDEAKNWVVNIVKITNSNIVIDRFTNELAEKAQKINAGGKWEYKSLPEGYFFIFKDFKKVNEQILNSIDIILSPTKEPC